MGTCFAPFPLGIGLSKEGKPPNMLRLYKFAGAAALAIALVAVPSASYAAFFVSLSVNFGPPALPVYVQPPCPTPGWVWTPGYWAYGSYGYYWVPGTWVPDPQVGFYWTPGYWGFVNNAYVWNAGYWGPQVGFYGGIDYGFGYFGNGYAGGAWYGNQFRYNTAYTNVNTTFVHNVYVNRTVVNYYGNAASHVAYNGGPGGVYARPSAAQIAYGRTPHRLGATAVQTTHIRAAAANRSYLAKVNHGRPATLALARPLGSPRTASSAAHARPATNYHATTYHANSAPAYHADHAATTSHAAAYHAPAYHAAAPAYHAPAYHAQYHAAAPAYHAQAYRAPARTMSAPHGAPAAHGGAPEKHNP